MAHDQLSVKPFSPVWSLWTPVGNALKATVAEAHVRSEASDLGMKRFDISVKSKKSRMVSSEDYDQSTGNKIASSASRRNTFVVSGTNRAKPNGGADLAVPPRARLLRQVRYPHDHLEQTCHLS